MNDQAEYRAAEAIATESPEYFDQDFEDYLLFKEMFAEAYERVPINSIKTVGGSLLPSLRALNEEYRVKLNKLDPELSFNILYPPYARGRLVTVPYHPERDVPQLGDQEPTIRRLRLSRIQKLHNLARQTAEDSRDAWPPLELDFADSCYMSKGAGYDCALTAWLMSLRAITGHRFSRNYAIRALRHFETTQLPDNILSERPDLEDQLLLNSYRSPAFKCRYPELKVTPLVIIGFTLEDLSRLVEQIKNKAPQAEVRAVLSVNTLSTSAEIGTVHRLIPLHMSRDLSRIHDPSLLEPGRYVRTDELLRRWYAAQGHGYLLISRTLPAGSES